jgi:hypothetical protein
MVLLDCAFSDKFFAVTSIVVGGEFDGPPLIGWLNSHLRERKKNKNESATGLSIKGLRSCWKRDWMRSGNK